MHWKLFKNVYFSIMLSILIYVAQNLIVLLLYLRLKIKNINSCYI